MARPADMQGLAAEAGEQTKAQIYAMSLMAIRVDSAAEASYLDGLAAALGLSEDTRRAIHSSMGLS